MKGIQLDAQSNVVAAHFAVVYAPRRQRGRFPENCVEIVSSADIAIQQADPAAKRYPAKVVGPSKSSEGVRIFYLDCWLNEDELLNSIENINETISTK